MKKKLLSIGIGLLAISFNAISQESIDSNQTSISQEKEGKLTIGGYGQIDYNQPFNDTAKANGTLDVHRLVILLGYQFNDRVSFVTEIETEHVVELYVEQAFINYKVIEPFSIRAGLMLIPMGIINEYHEPPTFNGVERPNLDNTIVPSTWREIGAGFTGNIDKLSIKYQAYVVNGFMGYNGAGTLRGSDGFRKGRQKGAASTISSPNYSAKLDFYGITGLKIGAAAYVGETQSTLYNGLLNSDTTVALDRADSSTVGLMMLGFDIRYQFKALGMRGQLIKASISNTEAYNMFTGKDLGSSMLGYYGEISYDVLSIFKKEAKEKIILFGRYEYYDTHDKVAKGTTKNDSYARTDITFGISYKVSAGAVFKADYQLLDNNGKNNTSAKQINLGVGVWF